VFFKNFSSLCKNSIIFTGILKWTILIFRFSSSSFSWRSETLMKIYFLKIDQEMTNYCGFKQKRNSLILLNIYKDRCFHIQMVYGLRGLPGLAHVHQPEHAHV